jgi:hypothetical protein
MIRDRPRSACPLTVSGTFSKPVYLGPGVATFGCLREEAEQLRTE